MAETTKTERLRCKLTAAERATKTDELTRLMAELDELKAKKAASAKDFAKRIADHEMRIASVAFDVRDSSELRPVDCYERPNYRARTVELVRGDEGEVVSTRAMTESERQLALGNGPDKRPPRAGSPTS